MEYIDGIEIKSLADVSFDEICEAFTDAFADYDTIFDKEQLKAMFLRRGARRDMSFAAFDQGRIVSFIINGIGRWEDRMTAYDTGTGTLPEYRGRGLTDRIFQYAVGQLAQGGVTQYLLEVLKHNIPAVKIYSRLGFEITREFECFRGNCAEISDRLSSWANETVSVRYASVEDVDRFTSFMDFTPSWQNSLDSFKRNPVAFLCLIASDGNRPVGFGVSETAYGDISLIAVDRAYRRRGVGSRIMYELLNNTRCQQAKVLNIDNECRSMKAFLNSAGFDFSCSQYEMILHL